MQTAGNVIIMGDFNTKVGKENVVGPHRLRIRNIRGDKLVECHTTLLKERLQQPKRRKWT